MTATIEPPAAEVPEWADAAGITPRQRDYLAAWLSLARPGRVPTLEAVGDRMGVCRITAWELQQALLRRGVLVKGPAYRSVRLNTPAGQRRHEADACRAEASRLREAARVAARLMREAHAALEGTGRWKLRTELRQSFEEIASLLGADAIAPGRRGSRHP